MKSIKFWKHQSWIALVGGIWVVFVASGWLLCSPALGFGIIVHQESVKRAFEAAYLNENLGPIDSSAPRDLRNHLYVIATRTSSREEFQRRYPSLRAFNSAEFKVFLMLNPTFALRGFDLEVKGGETSRGALMELGAIDPDLDRRNEDRVIDGCPFDPMTLAMGGLTGTSSRGHAHYGLFPGPKSDDPEVLKKEPHRFASPPDVETYCAEFVQIYTDLALIARSLPGRAGRALAAYFAGNALHHLGDLANQIHTVQVGLYDFVFDAKIESLKENIFTLWGLTGKREGLKKIALGILSNHHYLSEAVFAREFKKALERDPDSKATGALAALSVDDPEFRKELEKAVASSGGQAFGRVLAETLIRASVVEGSEIYRLTRTFAVRSLSRRGVHFSPEGDPLPFLRKDDPEAREAMEKFFELQTKAMARLGTVMRVWRERFEAAPASAGDGAIARLVPERLAYLEAAAKRRASFKCMSASH